jgi:hypothetical protein
MSIVSTDESEACHAQPQDTHKSFYKRTTVATEAHALPDIFARARSNSD